MGSFDKFIFTLGRRRTILSNKKIQFLLIAYPLIFSILYFVGLYSIFILLDFLNWPFFYTLESGFQPNASLAIVIAFSILLAAIVILIGFILTNRITGPLYRLNCHMQDIAQGKIVENISFRKNDYFQELPISFNLMLAQLHQKTPHSNDTDIVKNNS